MPNIQTFESDTRAPVGDNTGAEAYELEGRHIESAYSQAASDVGGAVSGIGQEIQKHDDLADSAALTNAFADLHIQTAQGLEAAKTTMDPHDVNAMPQFLDDHDAALQKIKDSLSGNPAGLKQFNELSANWRVNTANSFLSYQTAAAANDIVTKFQSGADKFSNLSHDDPTSTAANIEAQLVGSQGIPAEHRPEITKAAVTSIADSGAQGVVDKLAQNPNFTVADVEKARAYIDDPANPFHDNMSPAQYTSISAKLDAMEKTQGNVQSVIAAQTLDAGYKQLEQNGGVDNGNALQAIITNYQGKTTAETAEFKAKAQRDYDAAVGTGQATAAVKTTPDTDLQGDIKDLKAKLDTAPPEQAQKMESEYKAVVEAKKARDEAFTKDPADWVTKNNDVVGARYAQFQAKPTPQSFQQYAVASAAEQKRLYPNQTPRIVSDDMANNVQGAIGKITNDPQGAAAAAGILSDYSKIGGSYWPQMAQELYHRKVLNPTQFVAASLYGKPDGTGLAEEMLRTSVIPDKELADRNAGNPNMTDVKAREAANKAFGPLAQTLTDDRSPDSIVGAYEQSLARVLQARGNTTDATTLAAKMINDEYVFKGTYRIPNSAKVNADDVDAGLKSMLGNVQDAKSGINSANLIVPKSYSGLGPDDQRRAYVANIQRQGHWVTNSSETGAVLYDEQGSPVWQKGPKGQPQMVGTDWKTAADHGVSARGITGKVYKFLAGQQ